MYLWTIFVFGSSLNNMNEELFSRKESVKDIFFIIEDKLKKGLFEESMEDFDRIMNMDFEYANLYDNISCVKFWINRLDNLNKLKKDYLEYCKFLDSSYKKFCSFIRKENYKRDLISIKAIHYFVYNEIIELLMSKDINGKEQLHLLSNAFIELEDYNRGLKAYEYLNTIEPYNSNTLGFIAEINHKLGNEKHAKMYIREALFYEPLNIEFERITIEAVREIKDIIIKRGKHNNSEEEIISWMSAYGELMNILDIKKELSEKEEIELRKNISKLEADYRKFKLRDKVAPKLLSYYAFLTACLITRHSNSDMEEIEILGRKMATIDEELLQYYIKILKKR